MSAQRSPRRTSRGFTLIETLVAMAILVMALSALLGHQAVGIQMSDYSNKAAQAVLLLQGKLLDVEHQILSDSIDALDNCDSGDFRKEGFREFRWKVCAYKLEVMEGAADRLTDKFVSLLTGMAGVSDGLTGGGMGDQLSDQLQRAAGQMSMAAGMIPTFLQQLEDQIRKVRVEVTWKDVIAERQILIEHYVTTLGSDPVDQPPPMDGDVIDTNAINQALAP